MTINNVKLKERLFKKAKTVRKERKVIRKLRPMRPIFLLSLQPWLLVIIVLLCSARISLLDLAMVELEACYFDMEAVALLLSSDR